MKTCAVCDKGSSMGGRRSFLRSHYNPVGKFRKYPNLQWGRIGDGARVKMCVRCLKTMAKKAAAK
ncbi:MAG: 50S ribosomal protein L28 [Patescibacteria group bacterium]